MTRFGLPHSEILGSMDVCSFPRLIAACHVLHRLYVPRHSPYALNNFTKVSGALTACRHTVSGSISLSVRSTFHLSLTVLVHYRSHRSI